MSEIKLKYKDVVKLHNSLHELGSKRCEIDLAMQIAKFKRVLEKEVEFYNDEFKKIQELVSIGYTDNEWTELDSDKKTEWHNKVKAANADIDKLRNKESSISSLLLEECKISKSLIVSSEEKYGDIKKYDKLAFFIDGNTFNVLIDYIK